MFTTGYSHSYTVRCICFDGHNDLSAGRLAAACLFNFQRETRNYSTPLVTVNQHSPYNPVFHPALAVFSHFTVLPLLSHFLYITLSLKTLSISCTLSFCLSVFIPFTAVLPISKQIHKKKEISISFLFTISRATERLYVTRHT